MDIIKHSGCDGSHRGLADWYSDLEQGIKDALARGPAAQWTTGWYSSKHEIACGKISSLGVGDLEENPHQAFAADEASWLPPDPDLVRVSAIGCGDLPEGGKGMEGWGGRLFIEASVSDDFDTPGSSGRVIPHTTDLDKITETIHEVWDEAAEDQKDNRVYVGYSILTEVESHAMYIGGEPQGEPVRHQGWVETYLKTCGDEYDLDGPPGDNYYEWGFQGEAQMDDETKKALAAWAEANDEGEFTFGAFTIKPWSDE
jgi:hypothetical protein